MHSLGFDWEAVDFFSFIADVAEKHDHLQIMFLGLDREWLRDLQRFDASDVQLIAAWRTMVLSKVSGDDQR